MSVLLKTMMLEANQTCHYGVVAKTHELSLECKTTRSKAAATAPRTRGTAYGGRDPFPLEWVFQPLCQVLLVGSCDSFLTVYQQRDGALGDLHWDANSASKTLAATLPRSSYHLPLPRLWLSMSWLRVLTRPLPSLLSLPDGLTGGMLVIP